MLALAPCLTLVLAFAQASPEALTLWPEGAPGALGNSANDVPKLIVYHAAKPAASRAAFVICPGGGYGHLAMGHEGHAIARWLNTLGITGAILDYRHRGKGYGHPAPLDDAKRAVRLVRSHAEAWNLDPKKIGIIGFSAGGHLAASACVHFDAGKPDAADPVERQSSRPDFAVLCYPVIAFGKPFTHKGSQRNLLGKNPKPELVREMSAELHVTKATPPTFLWHTSADPVVPCENSVVYYLALKHHGVPCEMHLFENGRHGLGLAKGHAAGKWPELCRRWLVERGVLAKDDTK